MFHFKYHYIHSNQILFRVINFFDGHNLLQTLVFILGFLSLVNIVVNVVLGDISSLKPDDSLVPEARMLDTMAQVFDAINTIEEKYYQNKY